MRMTSSVVVALLVTASCSQHGSSGPADVVFPAIGSLSAASGKGSFRFGVATAATQIEDGNTKTDWYLWTEPTSAGGLGNDTFVGDAVMGYTDAIPDVQLLKQLGVDSYRFSMEWARIEPVHGKIDEAALQHYSDLVDALRAAGIRPLVTVHHFSNPVWIDDPRDPTCSKGPSDTNMCGLGGPGGAMVVQAFADHAKLLAQRFGDRVDEWGTINEPINYLLASYGVGVFPPGQKYVFSASDLLTKFVPVLRDYLRADVAMYDAIKQYDTVDADGDGVAADVGMSLATLEWVPSAQHALSTDPADVAAQGRVEYVFNHLFVDALEKGAFDPKLDQSFGEAQPTWKGKIDWLGVQYYERAGVTGHNGLFPVVNATPCFTPLDFGSCVPPLDPTFCVPMMKYEYDPAGLYVVLDDLGRRWPTLPLVVSEAGIATDVAARRAENVVRTLEQIDRARREGIDVRGYYHWSLMDNFEWNSGFAPHFGLYHVDRTTFSRTPTEGATVFSQITPDRTVTAAMRSQYGGTGPLTPDTTSSEGPTCNGPYGAPSGG